jgi:ABC-type multidrug transport system ATPase subunit
LVQVQEPRVALPPAAILHDSRRIAVGPAGLTLGRRSENDLILKTDRASRRHARIAPADDAYWLEDLGSMNGTYLNGERLRGESRWLSSGDTIVIGGEQMRFVLGDATRAVHAPSAPQRTERFQVTGGRMTLGRDAGNDVVLDAPAVSRFHAEIVTGSGHVELRDLGSTNGTRVNGELVSTAALELGSEIGIGPYRLIFDGVGFLARDDRGNVRLDAENVVVRAGSKQILAPTSVSVAPGELVAVIGESGSGKTTLVKALAGVTRPSAGTVLVSGEPVAARLTDIGYVPQEDIVHRSLTVREALRYSARLRLPEDATRADVEGAVERVLGDVALGEHADTRIDSLSGGQRKRAGVAVELLNEPGLLFLDEPTTGLDPGLESRMMSLLRDLANDGRAVTVVTHATKNLSVCDRLVVMGRGGELSFEGPPDDALRFFGVSSYDGIYAALEERPSQEWRERFETEERPPSGSQPPPPPPAVPRERPKRRLLPQAAVLTGRYLRLITRDRRNLLILLGQVPLLALGAAGLFKPDVFARGPGHAGNTAQLLFLLVTTTLWVGSIDASREIVKERPIAARERAAGVRVPAYLTSKVVVLFALAALQTTILCTIVFLMRPLHEPASVYASGFGLLVLTSFVAVGMGLVISALVRSQDQATSFIPLALIPQLFFAGAIVPVARMGEPISTLSRVIFAQWSFAGFGTGVDMNARIAADPKFTSGYGPDFFDVAPGIAAIVLLAFLEVFLLVTAMLLARRQSE